MCFLSGGTAGLFKAVCTCCRDDVPFTHTRTYPHTASVTLVTSFYKTLTLSSLSLLRASLQIFGDAHAEQSECAHMLVCLGFARCWVDPQNREVTVQAPFNWSVLSGAKQTIWHLDLVQSEYIKGRKNVLNGVFWCRMCNPVKHHTSFCRLFCKSGWSL